MSNGLILNIPILGHFTLMSLVYILKTLHVFMTPKVIIKNEWQSLFKIHIINEINMAGRAFLFCIEDPSHLIVILETFP